MTEIERLTNIMKQCEEALDEFINGNRYEGMDEIKFMEAIRDSLRFKRELSE